MVRANEGVAAINDILYNADSLGAGNAEVSALRDRFLRRNQSFDLWSHVPDPEEALRTLLGSSPGYSDNEHQESLHVAPYDRGLVALPQSSDAPHFVSLHLDPAAVKIVTNFENAML